MSTKINFSKMDGVALAIVAGTFVISSLALRSLPPVVATHFDLHGNANGWSSAAFAAYFAPSLAAVLWAILRFAPLAAPLSWRERMTGPIMSTVAALTVAFLAAVHFVVLHAALHGGSSVGRAVVILLGAMWIALAVILPRTRRNPLVGVRTAWTLSSDENWARTHRFASYTFLAGGLLALGAGLVGAPAAVGFAIATAIVSALAPAFYSWAIARHT